jgi:hypothetical protein
MKTHCTFFAFAALLAPALHAATVTFDTAQQYADNFTELVNASNTAWADGGYLQKDAGDSATVARFNDAGTSGTDTYDDLRISMDFRTSGPLGSNGNSVGFFVRGNEAGTSAYAAVFRMTSTTSADFRVWDSTANPSTGILPGSTLGSQTLTGLPANTFALDTFYSFRLDVANVGDNVVFTGSIYTQGGDLIGTFGTITDTTTPLTAAGEVYIRMGSNSVTPNNAVNHYDNFKVEVIPEPAAASLLGFTAMLAAFRRRR